MTVPAGIVPGPLQLKITTVAGLSTVNALTFHVLGEQQVPFPSAGILDNFNRGNGTIIATGYPWVVSNTGNNGRLRIQHPVNPLDGVVQVRNGTNRDWAFWNTAPLSPNQEAYFTFDKVSSTGTEQGLLLKLIGNNPNSTNGSSWIEVAYNAVTHAVAVRTKNNGQNQNAAVTQASFPVTFTAGQTLGARAFSDGTVRVYQGGTLVGSVNVTTTVNPWPAEFGCWRWTDRRQVHWNN